MFLSSHWFAEQLTQRWMEPYLASCALIPNMWEDVNVEAAGIGIFRETMSLQTPLCQWEGNPTEPPAPDCMCTVWRTQEEHLLALKEQPVTEQGS